MRKLHVWSTKKPKNLRHTTTTPTGGGGFPSMERLWQLFTYRQTNTDSSTYWHGRRLVVLQLPASSSQDCPVLKNQSQLQGRKKWRPQTLWSFWEFGVEAKSFATGKRKVLYNNMFMLISNRCSFYSFCSAIPARVVTAVNICLPA